MKEFEIILITTLIVLLLVIIWIFSRLYRKKNQKKLSLNLDIGIDEIPDFCDIEEKVIYFNYERLDDKMKYVYDTIYDSIQRNEALIEIGSCDQNTIDIVYNSILLDHPELFWLSGAYTFYSTDEGNKIKPVSIIRLKSIQRYKNKFEKKISAIIESTAMAEDTYQKILMLHDYIVDHSEYDIKAKEKYSSNPIASTSYGCIVDNLAICTGYAKGFQLLLNRIGVSCGCISGVCENGENHMWNYVRYGKDFYYVDVTFDDPLQKKKQYDNKSHRYFFVTTEDILKSREILTETEFIPECNSTKYNYFVYMGRFYKKYSVEALRELVAYNRDNEIEFRFATKEVYEEAVQKLFFDKECYDIIKGHKITYSKDDDLFVIELCY